MDQSFIEQALSQMLTLAGLTFEGCSFSQENDVLRIDVKTPEPSRLIGWHGETLNSFQHLLKAMIRTHEGKEGGIFVVLDVDGYRRMQEEKVCRIAEQKAEFVRRTGNRIALQPMSPYFRRIVHMYVAHSKTLSDLTTESVGQGDYRQIVLRLKEETVKSGEELTPVMAEANDDLGNLDV